MKVEIISIGDELLIGQVVNTNASWMGAELTEIGLDVVQITATSDRGEDIKTAMHEAAERADVVLMTGGLGPTNDDITKEVLCEYFNTKLTFHQPTYDKIEAMFKKRGYVFTERNQQQALLPESCKILSNSIGTAPGMWFENNGSVLVSMPGVPFEMKAIMKEEVIPGLKALNGSDAIFHHTVITHGVGESWLAEKIENWETALPENVKLAYLPRPGMVRLRITASGKSRETLKETVMNEVAKLEAIIPELIIGSNSDTMESVVKDMLIAQKKTMAVAESCTGGYISHLMTSMAGVSQCFNGGVVAYENAVKQHILGVGEHDLIMYGAVSESVVKQMAKGVREKTGSDYGVATSGIAGPDGGTEEKPVGTVWIAVADENNAYAKKFFFGGNRERVIKQSAMKALNELRKRLVLSK